MIVEAVYFAGVALVAAVIVCAGAFGWFGGWSDDSWPVYAITVPWFWPVLLPLMLAVAVLEPWSRNRCHTSWCVRRWAFDEPKWAGNPRCKRHARPGWVAYR